jgi:hypothetical protein
MWHPLWREDGSVIYNCRWSSPAQSFSGPSPAGLMTIFYCLRFETPPTWRARSPYLYPPGTGWPGYTPRHCVPFSSPPTTRKLRWRYSTPPPPFISSGRTEYRSWFPTVPLWLCLSVAVETCVNFVATLWSGFHEFATFSFRIHGKRVP